MTSLTTLQTQLCVPLSKPFGKEVKTGTSTMAIVYNGGVIVGADSRMSTGIYVANRHTDKLFQITDNIFALQSGSAADTETIADYVSYYLNQQTQETGEKARVKTAAKLVSSIIYNNKDYLLADMIVAGYDDVDGASLYSITLGGNLTKLNWTIGGSGSTYIYGFCDSYFRKNMSREDALKFVRKALGHAMLRDGYSGGLIRTSVITKDGVKRETKQPKVEPDF